MRAQSPEFLLQSHHCAVDILELCEKRLLAAGKFQ
jgi:hypothetical protein